MAAIVKCQLILQAAESSLGPNSPPVSGVYPNRVLLYVPGELTILAALTQIDHQITSAASTDCRALADKLCKAMGPNWAADTAVYSSGSIWQSGAWAPGSGYSFRIFKDNSAYERPLSIGTSSVLKYLISVQHLSDV